MPLLRPERAPGPCPTLSPSPRAARPAQPRSGRRWRWPSLLLLLASSARASDGVPAPHATLEPSSSPLWLRLRGGYTRAGEPRERYFGVLELGLALDVLVAGRASAHAAASGTTLTAGESPAPPRPLPAPHTAAVTLSPSLARATLLAALKVADAAAPPGRLDSLLTRTRTAASLPELRLAAGTSRDQSLRLTPTVADPAKFTQDGGRDLWFEARLTWHLERAIFSRDEIAIERLKAQALEQRQRLLRQVLDALMVWQRARQAQGSELVGEEEREKAALRELEALLRLDALTDGWFSRHLALSRWEPPSPLLPAVAATTKRHGLGNPPGAHRPQKARGCAKGASLTYRNSNASSKS